jgi:hypothetical protein
MTIRTPSEMMIARVALGLSRDELAHLCGITAHELKRREHIKGRGLPGGVLEEIEKLQSLQAYLAVELRHRDAIVTYWTDNHLQDHGFELDKLAPTASFHRAAAALAHEASRKGCIMLCYAHDLFTASDFAVGRDTIDMRRAWAVEWARNYTVAA